MATSAPGTGDQHRPVRVTKRRDVSDSVIELHLGSADGQPFPEWAPGAHIDVALPSGTIRQYSLCGPTGTPEELRIAVLLETDGRGGSREVLDRLKVGTMLGIIGPRNHFQLVPADRYVFVAGGIGITPILTMVRLAVERGAAWTLVYGGRSSTSMAYLPELEELAARSGDAGSLLVVPEDTHGRPDLVGLASGLPPEVPVYACGPEAMLVALEGVAAQHLAAGQLHIERFGATSVEQADDDGLDEFEVEISSTGAVLPVGPGDTLIDVVRTAVPSVPFSCEEGYCGSCETGVLDGLPCHRDQVLTADERAENDTMMICVGRSLTARLVLDL